MGDSHMRSNWKAASRGQQVSGWSDVKCGTLTATVGAIGTETVTTAGITTANITTANITTVASAALLKLTGGGANSYIKLAPALYIYWHTTGIGWTAIASVASIKASIEEYIYALATPASPLPGCIFLNATTGEAGGAWARGPTAASWCKLRAGS